MYYTMPLLLPNGHCLLLFLTICCCMMTSGHFVSPTADHHQHHYNHQYQEVQQQKKQYYFSPTRSTTFIPLIPRPHQHIVIRRSILPHQQHHPLPTINSYPVASTASLAKKIDRLEIEEELKALRKKRRRLRQLREEVRQLSNHLQNKRTFLKDDMSSSDLFKKHKAKEAHVRWRKQISTRVKAIMKRLKRLENGIKNERNLTKEPKKNQNSREKEKISGRLPILPVIFHTTPAPQTISIKTTKNFKIKRLHSSINQSKNGESGGSCSGHKDCKPGLCCHRTFSSVGISSPSLSALSSCHQYLLKEGEPCEDSCQCEARLHCFRSSSSLKTKTPAVKSKRDTRAICKKVSTEDIVNGVYLNSKDASFPMKQPIGHQL